MATLAHLTIFVCCHQLVDLLIGPGSQDLNETLLIGANALGEEKGHMSQGPGFKATSHGLGSWSGQSYQTPKFRLLLSHLIATDLELLAQESKHGF